MEQRLSIITIGVKNLAAMRDFYEKKFGWKPVAVNKDIVFYKMGGMLLSFFPEKDLSADVGLETTSAGKFSLAYLVPLEQEVDEMFALLESKGVEIVKKPVKTFFGAYTGYVKDVEGNLWDVGYNPLIPLDSERNVITHEDIRHLEQ